MLPESTGIIVDSCLIPFALVTLLTYLIYSSLRTLPGIILINLEVAYILFHIAFIIYQSMKLSEDDSGATCTVSNVAGFYTLADIGTINKTLLL